jgi:hypothetical protein
MRIRRYCGVSASKGQSQFKPANAGIASTALWDEKWRDFRNRAKDGDPEAVAKMDKLSVRTRKWRHNRRERADNGDEELKAKIDEQDAKKREYNRNLYEREKNGDPKAKHMLDNKRALTRAHMRKSRREAEKWV